MKHNYYLPFKSLILMIGMISLVFSNANAQSVNTKYRIKHNASGLYVGNNNNGNNTAELMALDANDDSQIWYLLETGTSGEYFLKNDDGVYLGRDPGGNWWETEIFSYEADPGFYTWTITQLGGGSTYYIDNTSVGDGESIGTDNTDLGAWISVNKSGANAEWIFEAVSTDFIKWNGTAWSNTTGPAGTDDVLVDGALDITLDIIINNLIVTKNGTITISSGTVTVAGGWDNQGALSVESGASLMTYDAGYAWGNITIKRNSSFSDADKQYSFIGSPVSGYDIANLSSGYHYTYNTSDDTYSPFSGEMIPGAGYTSAGKQALEFFGRPNTGTINVMLDNSGNQFNLVSNPFAAAIDRTSFLAGNSNITGAIYLWDDGGSNTGQRTSADFVTVTNAGTVSGGSGGSGATFSGYIGTAQGFIVQASTSGNVTFSESMRTTGNNADAGYFRKKETLAKLTLEVSNSEFKDQTLIAFSEEGTLAFDRMWDATKLFAANRELSLATIIKEGEDKLAIQTLPVLDLSGDKIAIPLSIDIASSGDYQFGVNNSTLPANTSVILEDSKTSEVFDLSEPVTIQLVAGEKDRFTLSIGSKAVVLSNNYFTGITKFYLSGSLLNLNIEGYSGESSLAIYDLGGRIYQQGNVEFIKGQGQYNLDALASGLYIMKLTQGTKVHTFKFRLNN